jgi:chromosomal replication initiation ATPase DnaA
VSDKFQLSDDDILRCRKISIGNRDLIMDIVRAVSEHTGIPIAHIQGPRKNRELSDARWLISYIAHVERGFPINAIARVLRKDHSSICHGVRKEQESRGEMAKAPE